LRRASPFNFRALVRVEAARGEPTAVVLASRDAALAAELQEEFAGPNFRLYTNDDVLGVELAGAMKNVMAIAAGPARVGPRFERPRGIDHAWPGGMARLARGAGGAAETLSGLAGLGDFGSSPAQARSAAIALWESS